MYVSIVELRTSKLVYSANTCMPTQYTYNRSELTVLPENRLVFLKYIIFFKTTLTISI